MNARDWLDYVDLAATVFGLLIVAAYTYVTYQMLRRTAEAVRKAEEGNDLAKQALELNRAAFKQAQADGAAALEQTRRSNEATEESNRIAAQSLEIGNRAWLLATYIESYALKAGDNPKLAVNIENLGNVPAFNIIFRGYVGLRTTPDALVGLIATDEVGSRAVAGPGRGIQAKMQFGALAEEAVPKILSGEYTLLAYCEIEYLDWFEHPRKTVACWKYDPEQAVWAAMDGYNVLE